MSGFKTKKKRTRNFARQGAETETGKAILLSSKGLVAYGELLRGIEIGAGIGRVVLRACVANWRSGLKVRCSAGTAFIHVYVWAPAIMSMVDTVDVRAVQKLKCHRTSRVINST
jgi:hypothetical protein